MNFAGSILAIILSSGFWFQFVTNFSTGFRCFYMICVLHKFYSSWWICKNLWSIFNQVIVNIFLHGIFYKLGNSQISRIRWYYFYFRNFLNESIVDIRGYKQTNFKFEVLSKFSLVTAFYKFYGIDNHSSLVSIFIACTHTWLSSKIALFAFHFIWMRLLPLNRLNNWLFLFYFLFIAHKVLAIELTQSLFAEPARQRK